MDILVMIAIVIMVVYVVTWNSVNLEARIASARQKQQDCTLHKWTYRKQPGTDDEYMICENCGMLPGGWYLEKGEDDAQD
jgi:hypothetical protein